MAKTNVTGFATTLINRLFPLVVGACLVAAMWVERVETGTSNGHLIVVSMVTFLFRYFGSHGMVGPVSTDCPSSVRKRNVNVRPSSVSKRNVDERQTVSSVTSGVRRPSFP